MFLSSTTAPLLAQSAEEQVCNQHQPSCLWVAQTSLTIQLNNLVL